MANATAPTVVPTPSKKARKPTVPLTRAAAAQKVAGIVKKLSTEDAMKVLDTVRSIVSL